MKHKCDYIYSFSIKGVEKQTIQLCNATWQFRMFVVVVSSTRLCYKTHADSQLAASSGTLTLLHFSFIVCVVSNNLIKVMALALSSSLKPLCSFSSSTTTSPSSTQQDSSSYRPAVILPAKSPFLSVYLYTHFMHCTPLHAFCIKTS